MHAIISSISVFSHSFNSTGKIFKSKQSKEKCIRQVGIGIVDETTETWINEQKASSREMEFTCLRFLLKTEKKMNESVVCVFC